MAAHAPDFNKNRLDRYIAACSMGNVVPVICINKIDLADESFVRTEMAVYERLGYGVMYSSAKTGQGLDELCTVLKHSVSALVGSSGVGKSSLINAVQSDLGLKTNSLREGFWKGLHTTTTAELLTLDMGGMVVDTPGMREFALWHEDNNAREDVLASFPDIEAAESLCRFRNCSHTHEPGCEVKRLVGEGKIEQARYKNYVKLTK
ncbi:MAG: Small ribosomal subunit biogenesis GTPase RsgA [Firmicutes bacterium]|nr:Small ribosomal subunit biogenesis GTPase RsgA [candidate division NPL-UPA2 bacterium]